MSEEQMEQQEQETVRCALCGREYAPGACRCQGCPLASHCQMLCCPYCGYRSVDAEGSTAARWLRRLLGGKEAPNNG